jgi:hypothetical protein
MPKVLATLTVAVLLLSSPATAQDHVQGPRSISSDSIKVTLTDVRLRVAGPNDNISESLTPTLEPSGSKEAQIWFTLGFMLDSCRIKTMERIDSEHPSLGSTLHDITFHCHYKASEFRSALKDMLE